MTWEWAGVSALWGCPRLMGVSVPASWAARPPVGQGWSVAHAWAQVPWQTRALVAPRGNQHTTGCCLCWLVSGVSPSLSSACFSHRSIHTPALTKLCFLEILPSMTSSTGEGNGNPPQYSCLVSPMDRGAWWPAVHRVAKELDPT